MDGNRRWATERGKPKLFGHTEGAKTLKKVAKACKERNIPYMTVWALSTENLQNRSETELKHLFSLFNQLTDYLNDFFENNTKLKLIGNLSELPEKTQDKLNQVVEKTKDNDGMTLTLAVNYGGRDEIMRAFKKLMDEQSRSPLLMGEVSTVIEEKISQYLDTHDLPDPDLIIRTGGHQRLSGFLPWQSTYSELYFTDTFWPDFDETELDKAIAWFEEQQRNRGK